MAVFEIVGFYDFDPRWDLGDNVSSQHTGSMTMALWVMCMFGEKERAIFKTFKTVLEGD